MKKNACVFLLGFLACGGASATETINGTFFADTIVVGDWMENVACGTPLYLWTNRGPHKFVNGTLTALSGLSAGESLVINGSSGSDTITMGNDVDNHINTNSSCGSCCDYIKKITSQTPPAVTIDGGSGSDTITGSEGIDGLIGGSGDDLIEGRGSADLIVGLDTSCTDDCPLCMEDELDSCFGEAGNDLILCDDLANGGDGTDECFSDSQISCEDTSVCSF